MTYGRRLDGYTISSPCEPDGLSELKPVNRIKSQTFYKSSEHETGLFLKSADNITPTGYVLKANGSV